MSAIWFSGDWHYGHKNIVLGCSNWEDKTACRNFQTLQEHNDTLIQNINNNCKRSDIIYFLGDWSFGGKDNVEKFRHKINCKNIHLIFGNHDLHIKKNYNNCQSLFNSCKEINYKKIGNDNFVMCHYAMRTWIELIMDLLCYMDIVTEHFLNMVMEMKILKKNLININYGCWNRYSYGI